MKTTLATRLAAVVSLAGCTVGPDYQRPEAPVPLAYKEAAQMEANWQVARPADASDRGAWWAVFHDPVLDALEQQIDISNQNLKAAEATFRQAEAIVAQARAGYFPTAQLNASAQRSRGGSTGGTTGGASSTTSSTSTSTSLRRGSSGGGISNF